MSLQEPFYDAADFFLVRCALLPHQQLDISPEPLLGFYQQTPLFQEAIAIASPSLHQSLQTIGEDKERLKNVYPALLKYFLRMSSRATPFGLFSAVSWGTFSTKTDLSFSLSSIDKHIKPDMEWVKAFIDYLHNQIDCVRHLKVMTNPTLIKKSGRVSLRKKNEKLEKLESISIKSTLVSDFIFYHAKKPILYSELENALYARFENHPKDKVSEYLWNLFQKEFLLSEWSICLDQSFSFEHLYEKLKKIGFSDSLPFLNTLHTAIQQYENADLGKGLPQLTEAMRCLLDWKQVKYPVQVDAYRKTGTFVLPECVKRDVSEAASLLWMFSNYESKGSIVTYKNRFLEKYGSSRLVPLLELIDAHQGLGSPVPEVPPQDNSSSLSWESTLLSALTTKEIQLDQLSFPIPSQDLLQKAPLSLELYVEVFATSQEEIDSGNYTLVINPAMATTQAGTTFGRFLYLFNSSHVEQLRQFLQKEQNLYPQVAFVEASFIPNDPRFANVTFHEKIRHFQLQMHYHENSPEQIALEDIYVGCTADHLYLYSKKLGKELSVSLGSAINPQFAPPPLKLLLDISQSRFTSFAPFIWYRIRDHIFLPATRYKNIVLSPARWFFTTSNLQLKSPTPSSEEATRVLKEALNKFNVPDDVYLASFDNRILVNWKNPHHFQLIVQAFTTQKEVTLLQAIGIEKKFPTQSDQGCHITEFVIPCIKKSTYKINDPEIDYPTTFQISPRDRLHLPGGEWVFIKLFVSSEEEEFLLKNQIHPLIQQFLTNNWIDKWFYVRYKEEKPHVRLRFHSSSELICQKVIPFIHQQASQWMVDGLISDFSFHSYEREVERYGGPAGIELAEQIFCADSHLCLHLLNEAKTLDLPTPVWGAYGVLNLVQSFYSEVDQQLHFLSQFGKKNKQLLSGFRTYTPKAVEFACDLFYEANNPSPNIELLRESFRRTRTAAQQFHQTISQVSDIQWSTQTTILNSLMHMHCNRLMGIHAQEEQKARVVAHYLLEKIRYKLVRK